HGRQDVQLRVPQSVLACRGHRRELGEPGHLELATAAHEQLVEGRSRIVEHTDHPEPIPVAVDGIDEIRRVRVEARGEQRPRRRARGLCPGRARSEAHEQRAGKPSNAGVHRAADRERTGSSSGKLSRANSVSATNPFPAYSRSAAALSGCVSSWSDTARTLRAYAVQASTSRAPMPRRRASGITYRSLRISDAPSRTD